MTEEKPGNVKADELSHKTMIWGWNNSQGLKKTQDSSTMKFNKCTSSYYNTTTLTCQLVPLDQWKSK